MDEEKTCFNCEWHQDFGWEEIDGVKYDDGCVCWREPEGTHGDSCPKEDIGKGLTVCPEWSSED